MKDFMFKYSLGVIGTLFVFWVLILLGSCSEDKVYIGPVSQTSSGGEYFCTFENKSVFYEYQQEKK